MLQIITNKSKEVYNGIFENLAEFRAYPEDYKVDLLQALPHFNQSQVISLLAIVQDNYEDNQKEIKAHKEAGNETSWSYIDEDGMVDSDSIVSDELRDEYNKEEVLIEMFNALAGKINLKTKNQIKLLK